jgi:(1->4)-alpha-D-glucan 1-alpha-D-glucosylmutase
VYRAYIAKPDRSTPRDRDYITAATLDASKRNPRTSATLFEFIRSTLLLENLDDFPEGEQRQMTEWVMRFQQITGSVMAKGVEDTAFYIFNRLVSLNEVGGDPVRFGISTGYFHNHNMERARTWPHSLLASTTHDTKRSEDVRARINVLSEIPGEWAERLRRWREWNAPFKADADEEKAPDANDEFLLYQTLVGAWPAEVCGGKTELFPKILPRFTRRMVRYMQKAIKEAKIHTSWVNPNEAYETAVEKFVTAVLDGNRRDSFWEDFLLFQDRVGFFGFLNSLSQLLLKLSCPGIPDVYQGSELWDLRLVDPDNREVVDFAARIDRLREIEAQCRASAGDFSGEQPLKKLVASILGNRRDGNIKLFILYRTLRFRRENSLLFTYGDYVPVHAEGSKSEHICSFRRSSGKEDAVVAVPRLCVDLTDGDACLPLGEDVWKDTRLLLPDRFAGHRYRNVFTDEVCTVGDNGTGTGLPVREVISRFPVALLESVVED